MRAPPLVCSAFALVLSTVGCEGAPEMDPDNPFLAEPAGSDGKSDSAYLNPDGIEVEVDLEGEVEGPSWQLADGPAVLGQFALTYLRKRGDVYLESLAEDSTADDRAEWLWNNHWYTASQIAQVANARLSHWRMRGVNAVLLFAAAQGATVGKVLTAQVPTKPFSIYADAGSVCADPNHHISLDQSVYWYLWNPDTVGCRATTQNVKVTVSKMLPKNPTVYPEYDRLLADKKLTSVILFGQIGDGPISDSDEGMLSFRKVGSWLLQAGFKKTAAPLGERYAKTIRGNTVEVDLYSPHEFSGLGDFGHFGNFQKALSEHEIVAYDGHSMLGASDFWAKPTYNKEYQIYLYGGCLGYQYYVRPILNGKGGWQNVDILSSVTEVTATAYTFAAPALGTLFWAIDHGNRGSWTQILNSVRRRVGDSTFGVSGVRNNCYTPTGSRCH